MKNRAGGLRYLSFLKKNLAEIEESIALRLYGFFLSVIHVLFFFYWSAGSKPVAFLYAQDRVPLCWPFIEHCGRYRWPDQAIRLSLYGYLGLSILTAAFFLVKRGVKFAYATSIVIWIFEWAFMFQDFRLTGNYHYFTSIILFAYLFIPKKMDLLRLLIVGFYFSAGVAHWTPEWTSGAAIADDSWLSGQWFQIGCCYVLFLELFIIWGLLAKRSWVFFGAVAQVILFHLYTWHIVGYFYPTVMLCIVSILLLGWVFEPNRVSPLKNFCTLKLNGASYVILFLYTAAQAMPLFYPGDTTLSGEGHLVSVGKFGRYADCRLFIVSRFKDYQRDDSRALFNDEASLRCTPFISWQTARDLCGFYEKMSDFIGLDLALYSKRLGEASLTPRLSITDFCKKNTGYKIFGHNQWSVDNATTPTLMQSAPNLKRFFIRYSSTDLKTEKRSTLGEPTFLYREDIHRTGINWKYRLADQLEVAWKAEPINVGIHTASKSSPSVDDTGIYVGADSSYFYAFDHDGHRRWRFYVLGAGRGFHSTAALDNKRAYIGAYNGTLYALNKSTGNLDWAVQLGDSIGASPVLYNGAIYAAVELGQPVNGFVAKLDAVSGEVQWTSPLMGEQTHSSPVINEKAGLIYAGANNGLMYAFDLNSGAIRWTYEAGGSIKSTSTLIDDGLYLTSWAKNFIALDAKAGKLQWQVKLNTKSRTSPTLVPGLETLIVADEAGGIYAVKKTNGTLSWSIQTHTPLISSALVIRNNQKKWRAWLPCEKRSLCALDPRDGRVISRITLDNVLTSVPTAWKGFLYVSLNKTGGLVKLRPNHLKER